MEREDVVPSGYDKEERYFHEQEKDLLRNKREQLDAARSGTESEARKKAHWMKCPKCGSDLREIDMESIKVDKCPGCGGIFFDRGELELMVDAKKAGGWLKKLIT